MKHYNRIALAALFLLAGAASGARAENPGDGTVFILPPEHGAVLLPEISSGTAKSIEEIHLAIELIDGTNNLALPAEAVLWREGSWKNPKRTVVSRVVFPLKDTRYLKDPNYRYKLRYTVSYHKVTVKDTALVYLPLSNGQNFWITADFPFDFLKIDAGKLEWADNSGDDGLRNVTWRIKRTIGGTVKQAAGYLSAKEPQASVVPGKEDGLTADITFHCVLNKRASQVKWADNGKDLRKLPSGLNIVLTQPDCPK